MIGIADFEKSEHISMVVTRVPQYNIIWGVDFMLMDSNTFMGGRDGSEYENVIEMFVNIRNANECRGL